MKEISAYLLLFIISLASLAISPNDKAFTENFNIDPRVYALVLFFGEYESEGGEGSTGEQPEFKLPTIKFFENKSLTGTPVGILSKDGLESRGKKLCSVYKISNGKYDVLYEDVLTKEAYGSKDYNFRDYFGAYKLVAKEGEILKRCSYLKNSQKAAWTYHSILILENLDEEKSIGSIMLNSKVAYFSTKNLKVQAILRPPIKELEHHSISLVELAKEIEKALDKYEKDYISKRTNKVTALTKYLDVYQERENKLINTSALDWLDKFGEEELKKRLIEKFGGLRFFRYFDLKNMYITSDANHTKINNKFIIKETRLYLKYKDVGTFYITIDRKSGQIKYHINEVWGNSNHVFNGLESRYIPKYLD
ncbi:hypothetical protein [Halobacteriovorax sp. JY17]|uniref:hypothetical protein n=1 Tax=Halobacteriovorax sp. JY17 TaxID=2014617 RepID=UPI000C42F17F|nr:hypothetical protein [Halobacteriovorax sp. JY17]PIK13508.1 MAG: hypothetical protein CES88_16445 [Halobacteriovorax sp. JY17]